MARRFIHDDGCDRIRLRTFPPRLHFFRSGPHSEAVDTAVTRERADNDRKPVSASACIDDVREQESTSRVLLDAADVLPAHQRVQLRIFVDRPVDGQQQAFLTKKVEMLVEVRITAYRGWLLIALHDVILL